VAQIRDVHGQPGEPGTTIRAAREDDLVLLVEIERAAGESFRSLGMDFVADDDPGSVAQLAPYVDAGRAFVFVDADDRPVAYLLLDVIDGAVHVEQVSVHPGQARQGIGRALIERAVAWGRDCGLTTLTLTTYVDVPWNGPYYQRLGFSYVPTAEETPGLRVIRESERASGLDKWRRACMRLTIDQYP
jgi:GNAT superfamily N-acetyltransferase